MSREVKIPSDMSPFICYINGIPYTYKSGTTQTVPDEVADLIDHYNNKKPLPTKEDVIWDDIDKIGANLSVSNRTLNASDD